MSRMQAGLPTETRNQKSSQECGVGKDNWCKNTFSNSCDSAAFVAHQVPSSTTRIPNQVVLQGGKGKWSIHTKNELAIPGQLSEISVSKWTLPRESIWSLNRTLGQFSSYLDIFRNMLWRVPIGRMLCVRNTLMTRRHSTAKRARNPSVSSATSTATHCVKDRPLMSGTKLTRQKTPLPRKWYACSFFETQQRFPNDPESSWPILFSVTPKDSIRGETVAIIFAETVGREEKDLWRNEAARERIPEKSWRNNRTAEGMET